jgi:hypothetical protein
MPKARENALVKEASEAKPVRLATSNSVLRSCASNDAARARRHRVT